MTFMSGQGKSVSYVRSGRKVRTEKNQNRIEELLEMENISYMSTPRPGAKRGGGAAIAVNSSRFSVSKLNIYIFLNHWRECGPC